MNLTPWGGPLARAASALHVEPADVFVPMLPAMAMGIAAVFGLAWLLGRREKAASRSPLAQCGCDGRGTHRR